MKSVLAETIHKNVPLDDDIILIGCDAARTGKLIPMFQKEHTVSILRVVVRTSSLTYPTYSTVINFQYQLVFLLGRKI
jgi:hypothetical protein